MEEDWALTDAQRAETVSRVRDSISGLAFFRGAKLPDAEVAATAEAAEKKAYTVARVEARTTTGVRPHHETLKVGGSYRQDGGRAMPLSAAWGRSTAWGSAHGQSLAADHTAERQH